MRRRVDPPRQTAHHPDPGKRQLVAQLLGQIDAVTRGIPRADDPEAGSFHRRQVATVVQHHGRIVDFPEKRRIVRILAIDHPQAVFADLFQLRRQIKGLLPSPDRFRHRLPHPFHPGQPHGRLGKKSLDRPENLPELSHPDRTHQTK